jgi:pimeloyl-ACP methyl ester carboxylesterase
MTKAPQTSALEVHEGSVHSADGTRIGFHRLGWGPPIVFVHGSVSTYTDWMPVAHLLAPRFTCYAMDRRGRNRSGDGAAYSIEREYEDILAVLAAAGPGTFLAGHSYGAICALGAALRRPVPRMVIYEPPFSAGGPGAVEHVVSYRRAIEEGNTDRAVEIIFRHFIRLTEDEIAAMRHTSAWSRLRHLAPTWVREIEAVDALPSSVEHYRAITCPTLILVGAESPEHPLQDSSRALASVLPNGRVVRLPGQSHFAMRAAPELVAGVIGEFLRDGDD